ncbi:Glycosyl transferase, family 35, partial [Corchorus capsularis]
SKVGCRRGCASSGLCIGLCRKQKLVPRISICFSLMMDNMNFLHSLIQQICVVLYPGDTTENGKLLRLKQQFFLCSASLQDIILRFKERRSGKGLRNGLNFPARLLTIAYTNHTVLPEALEKWSQPVMWKLLPGHMEIIEEIDKRFLALINATCPDLGHKLPSKSTLDHNPQKPVVTMANLCVVSAHTVSKPQQTFPQ